MNTAYLIGIVCGIAVGIIALVVMMKFARTDGALRCKYDERQRIVRATGFKFAFFTLLFYDLAYGIINSAMDKRWMDDLTGMFIGCCISVVVYAAYAIWNEGYFSLNENPRRMLFVFGVVGLCNMVIGVRNVLEEGLIQDGMLNSKCLNLVCGLTFIFIFVILFTKWQVSKREDD